MSDEPKLTPMLSQYRALKARFPDAILLFRLGDFYETFEADAKTCARELELVLTHRSFAKGVRLPMAGVPHHHVQAYIAKLIDKGFKVALVEQLEDPKKVKRLVKRDVVRVITPGTVVEEALLKSKSDNYLAAVCFATEDPSHRPYRGKLRTSSRRRGKSRSASRIAEDNLAEEEDSTTPSVIHHSSSVVIGLAAIDLSTGEFATTQLEGAGAQAKLFDELERIQPSEYLLPESLVRDETLRARLNAIRPARISPLPDRAFEAEQARQVLLEHFRVSTLQAFGCDELPLAAAAAGAALQYLKTNQPASGEPGAALRHVNHLWTYSLDSYMTLDAATRRNLELVSPLLPAAVAAENGRAARSLFGVLDHTETAMGARLLKRWINQPLLDVEQIRLRQDAVAELHRDAFLRTDLRKLLDGLYDLERLVGRIGFGAANARDLIGLKRTLLRIPRIKARLNEAHSARLRTLNADLDELDDVLRLIDQALVDDPPILIKEGGLIKEHYDPALDALRDGAAQGKLWLAQLEEKERSRTGIKTLRVRYNEVFGFFIEAPRRDAHLIPKNYERRATILHAERYVTPELTAQEASILSTQDRVKDLEYELFVRVRREVASHAARLQTAARILAQLDALGALADAAARYGYVQPLVDDGDTLEIEEGRHPVVERYLREGEVFVPNHARLAHDTQRVLILTGPNMSGKSVYIRQIALIVLMAQIGSFVPARGARIGVTDRIFTRVGASDDIAQGRSTFLVEMSETSHILRHATPRSLIVLDEVGRGTSTYDGISLAWAIVEELHNVIGAKTLFATHYHELMQLADAPTITEHGGAVKNFTMAVQERGNAVVFLRQVIEGGAEKSFGIHVAQLAGLPGRVIARAEQVLEGLERERGDSDRETRETGENREREGTTEDERRATVDLDDEARETRETRGRDISTGSPSAIRHPPSAILRESQALYEARVNAWREVLRQLSDADIANMTPVQALVLLNELQGRVNALEGR